MSEELKSCPFCGGDSVTLQSLGDHTRAGCVDCGAEVTRPMGLYRNAMIEWNTRPIEDDLRNRIAELVSSNMVMAKGVLDLKARIAELEAESERFTVHSDIERQDDKWIPEVK